MISKKWKSVTFWIGGSFLILLGAMISGNAEIQLGVSQGGFAVAILLAFMLIMLGGLLWISVATAMKKIHEA
jgi:NhaP-type Na+/H+ or K+/H+ antiporter